MTNFSADTHMTILTKNIDESVDKTTEYFKVITNECDDEKYFLSVNEMSLILFVLFCIVYFLLFLLYLILLYYMFVDMRFYYHSYSDCVYRFRCNN